MLHIHANPLYRQTLLNTTCNQLFATNNIETLRHRCAENNKLETQHDIKWHKRLRMTQTQIITLPRQQAQPETKPDFLTTKHNYLSIKVCLKGQITATILIANVVYPH